MTDAGREDGWSARALRARRGEAQLTQEELAAAAGLDRTTINALEKNRRVMSPYYAELLAPELGVTPDDLLEPTPPAETDTHPLALLAGLVDTVGDQQRTIDELTKRVQDLESRRASRRRAGGEP